MKKNKPFKLKSEAGWWRKGNVIESSEYKLLIMNNPPITWWNAIKRFFGFRHEYIDLPDYEYKVKIIGYVKTNQPSNHSDTNWSLPPGSSSTQRKQQ